MDYLMVPEPSKASCQRRRTQWLWFNGLMDWKIWENLQEILRCPVWNMGVFSRFYLKIDSLNDAFPDIWCYPLRLHDHVKNCVFLPARCRFQAQSTSILDICDFLSDSIKYKTLSWAFMSASSGPLTGFSLVESCLWNWDGLDSLDRIQLL